jgi:exosome complex RNA-binding protein Rrp4
MGVVVTSGVKKSAGTISGNAVKIVVVKTEPGYAPDPGDHGTGTIVATYC